MMQTMANWRPLKMMLGFLGTLGLRTTHELERVCRKITTAFRPPFGSIHPFSGKVLTF